MFCVRKGYNQFILFWTLLDTMFEPWSFLCYNCENRSIVRNQDFIKKVEWRESLHVDEATCVKCGKRGVEGELIPGPFKKDTPDTDEYNGRMVTIDKWLNDGEDRIFFHPYCGYARTTEHSTPRGGPGFVDPISQKQISLSNNYSSTQAHGHHTIYGGEWDEHVIW